MASVQFSCSVVSDSLRPHELQHARPPCRSPTPGVHSNSWPFSRWRHPAISASVVPFSSWPQSLPASASFPLSQLFAWGGQSIGVSASASVLPMNTQDWSPVGWTGWISLRGLDILNLICHSSGGKKSVGFLSYEASLLAWQIPAFSCVHTRLLLLRVAPPVSLHIQIFSSSKDTDHIGLGPTLRASF